MSGSEIVELVFLCVFAKAILFFRAAELKQNFSALVPEEYSFQHICIPVFAGWKVRAEHFVECCANCMK